MGKKNNTKWHIMTFAEVAEFKAESRHKTDEFIRLRVHHDGIETEFTTEKAVPVMGEHYIEGRKITHFNEKIVVADGLHFNIDCIPHWEILEIIVDK